MSPDVLARKLRLLQGYLSDLEEHGGRTADDLLADPYEIVASSIEPALEDFGRLLRRLEERLPASD